MWDEMALTWTSCLTKNLIPHFPLNIRPITSSPLIQSMTSAPIKSSKLTCLLLRCLSSPISHRRKPCLEMASSSSSMTGRSRRRVAMLRQPSRKDNYEGPLRYYHHILEAPKWMAWTEGNLGRRFYGCPNYYKEGGCGFFAWHDEDFGERANKVKKELLDALTNCIMRILS